MKKHLIAVLLTACLLFSFGTTAFADPSGGEESNTDGANISVTKDGTVQGEEKASGYFGYYLSSEDAKWPLDGNGKETYPYNVEQYKDNGKTKYREMTRVEKGAETTVTTLVPVLSEHTFLGWGDKKRDRTDAPDQSAAIREAGKTIVYYYKNGKAYTLDALWGSLSIEGGSKVYDGQPIGVNAASFALNDVALSDTYADQYEEFLNCESQIQYSTDKNDENSWTPDLNEFKFVDAGSYTLYAKQKVLVTLTDFKSGDTKQETREVVGQATYTIAPRPVTLTSASDTKVYDGEALTNDTVTAEGKGFVEGQGVTITVTGTQTEVGSSDNTFTYEPKDNNTNLSNYKITTQYGTLTVTAKTTPDPVVPNPTPNTTPTPETTPTPTPTPVVTPAPTAAPSTDDTTPENTATPAPTATAAPTATPAPAPTAAPAAARAATTIPQTGDNFPAVALVIVMLAAIVGLGITVVLRTDKKK